MPCGGLPHAADVDHALEAGRVLARHDEPLLRCGRRHLLVAARAPLADERLAQAARDDVARHLDEHAPSQDGVQVLRRHGAEALAPLVERRHVAGLEAGH
eukprot:1505959-Alexandrium_andersonii.AAC.1